MLSVSLLNEKWVIMGIKIYMHVLVECVGNLDMCVQKLSKDEH